MKQTIVNLTYSCNRSCSYCFAKDFSERWPGEISLKELESIFKWISKQKIKSPVNFLGGEPTLFSKINEALGLAKKYGIEIIFCTNGIFDIRKVNVTSSAIALFGINLNDPSEYSSQELELLYFNIKNIRKTFKRISFRFNITSITASYKYLIDICERLNIYEVELSTIFPSISGKNKYIQKNDLKNFSPYILKLVKDLLKHNIQIFFSGPLPLCIFSEKERNFLINKTKLHGVCGAGRDYAITPDLTVLPCSSLAVNGPSLKSFKNEEEIFDYYKEFIDKLKWEVDLFPECKDCDFRKKKQCQGSCLVYKLLKAKKLHKLTSKELKLLKKKEL